MSEMKAIMKRLASGLRKQECRQHCRRLMHVCPHSDRSLGLIDREQSGCHYGLSLPVSLSFLPFFSLREPLSSVLACRAFLSFFLPTFPVSTSVQQGRTEGSLKASRSAEVETSRQISTPGLLTSQQHNTFCESTFQAFTEVTQDELKMFFYIYIYNIKPLLPHLTFIDAFFKCPIIQKSQVSNN